MCEDVQTRALKTAYIITGFLALMCLGMSYGWSVFRGHFRNLYPTWTTSNLSMVFSLSMIFFGVGSFLSSALAKWMSLGQVIFAGGVMVSAGFLGVSHIPLRNASVSYVMVCLLYGVLCGTGIGVSYNAINSSIPRFFPECKGAVSGVMMAGYGSGALVLGTLAGMLIEQPTIGFSRTFRVLGVLILGIVLLCALTFGKIVKSTAARKTDSRADETGYRPDQVIRMSEFWVLLLRNIFSYAACLVIIENATGFASSYGLAGAFGLMISVFNGLARLPSGILCDRIGSIWTLRIGSLLLVIAAAVMLFVQNIGLTVLLIPAFVLVGISYGITPPVSVTINDEFFGAKYRAENYAFFSFTLAPASLIGPNLVSLLQDNLFRQRDIRFMMVLLLATVSLLFSIMLRRPSRCDAE